MNKDELLSKQLAEVEERHKHYLAMQVESSGWERAGDVGVDASSEKTANGPASSDTQRVLAEVPETPASILEPYVYTWIECAQDEVLGRGTG